MQLGRWFGLVVAVFSASCRRHLSVPEAVLRTSLMQSPWDMKKAELVEELRRRKATFHESWTVPELRPLLMEYRPTKEKNEPTHKLSHQALREKCISEGMSLLDRVTRGTMLRTLRDSSAAGPTTLVTFGRNEGYTFSEVPKDYLDWAVQEVRAQEAKGSQPSPDLARMATWWISVPTRTSEAALKPKTYVNPEEGAVLPPPPKAQFPVRPRRDQAFSGSRTRPTSNAGQSSGVDTDFSMVTTPEDERRRYGRSVPGTCTPVLGQNLHRGHIYLSREQVFSEDSPGDGGKTRSFDPRSNILTRGQNFCPAVKYFVPRSPLFVPGSFLFVPGSLLPWRQKHFVPRTHCTHIETLSSS